jgi:hypothetical protein
MAETLAQKNARYATESDQLVGRIRDFATGTLKAMTTDAIGTPVDIINAIITPFGIGTDEPVGGSKSLRRLTGQGVEDASSAETLGTLINPTNAAKAMIVGAMRVAKKGGHIVDSATVAQATKLRNELNSEEQIFKQTATYMDKDRIAKTIMSDANTKINPLTLEVNKAAGTMSVTQGTRLGDLLDDSNDLFSAYPELLNVKVKARGAVGSGSMQTDNAFMSIGPQKNIATLKSVVLHETQHAVQHIEGFTKGGSTTQFLSFDPRSVQVKLDNARKSGDVAQIEAADRYAKKFNANLQEASNRYLNIAGEQEARFTQNRANFSFEELTDEVSAILRKGDTPQTYDTRPIRPVPASTTSKTGNL